MKPARRILRNVFLIAGLFGVFAAIALLPGKPEGVYNPLSISSTMGCSCDQFEEFRDGKLIFHVMEDGMSFQICYYEKDPAGVIRIKIPEWQDGKSIDRVLARVEPHLLLTKFIYDDGKSEWRWKRPVTSAMNAKMTRATIVTSSRNSEGYTSITRDSKFNVLKTRFFPKATKNSPADTVHP